VTTLVMLHGWALAVLGAPELDLSAQARRRPIGVGLACQAHFVAPRPRLVVLRSGHGNVRRGHGATFPDTPLAGKFSARFPAEAPLARLRNFGGGIAGRVDERGQRT
jgi:hypothetical protein